LSSQGQSAASSLPDNLLKSAPYQSQVSTQSLSLGNNVTNSQLGNIQAFSSRALITNIVTLPQLISPPQQPATSQPSIHTTNINNIIATALAQLIQSNQVGFTSPNSSAQNVQPSLLPQGQQATTVMSSCPFEVKFLSSAIKVCAGCRSGYARAADGKSYPPPNDLCLVHKEQHLYYNTVNARQQLSSLSNVHYRANVKCPRIRFMNFDPSAVRIPDDIREKLLEIHKKFLFKIFGIQ